MDLRVLTEPQQGASYDTLLRVARAAEDLGFDGFFRSDHYRAGGATDGLPGPTDCWTTLAGLARETTRIRLGSLVTPATFRLPGPLAIQVAQVDQMSGGRVELALGAGWDAAEHAAYGIPFPNRRFDLLEEQLQIVKGLWATPVGGTYTFKGGHYQLTESPRYPKRYKIHIRHSSSAGGDRSGPHAWPRHTPPSTTRTSGLVTRSPRATSGCARRARRSAGTPAP